MEGHLRVLARFCGDLEVGCWTFDEYLFSSIFLAFKIYSLQNLQPSIFHALKISFFKISFFKISSYRVRFLLP